MADSLQAIILGAALVLAVSGWWLTIMFVRYAMKLRRLLIQTDHEMLTLLGAAKTALSPERQAPIWPAHDDPNKRPS